MPDNLPDGCFFTQEKQRATLDDGEIIWVVVTRFHVPLPEWGMCATTGIPIEPLHKEIPVRKECPVCESKK